MKHILLIATGGTIASAEDGQGLTPSLTGEELAAAVPEITDLCTFEITQPMNIDSTNMLPQDWLRIANIIQDAYDRFDGFLVLHGTDTMAYTAAALSYLIQDSPKPIALTGSQRPMLDPFTDAKLNLYQSLLWLTADHARNVAIIFGGVAVAGTRARKQRTLSSNAFISVNCPPLAYLRGNRIVRTTPVSTRASTQPATPRFYNTLDSRVMVLKMTPGVSPCLFHALAPNYDALIIETFGLGGIPAEPIQGTTFHDEIKRWVESGRSIIMTTQVPEEGLDLGVYEVGRAYADMPGIIQGGDMTTEALVAKTMWALGQTRDPATLEQLFLTPINYDRTAE